MTLETWRIYLELYSSMRNAGILKKSVDGGELTRNINQNEKSDVLKV